MPRPVAREAIDAGTPAQIAAARRAIDGLVAEHRAYVARALVLRDAALALVDAALVSSDADIDA